MVVFDATTLLLLLSPNISPPNDPVTGQPVKFAKERIDSLVAHLEKEKIKIIIPTPALSEILVRSGRAGPNYLEQITTSSAFKIVPFDIRAAVEVAAMTRQAVDQGNKRSGIDSPWAKIKYDRQIVAIAKVEAASAIYSEDDDVRRLSQSENITVIRVSELPVPPNASQTELFEKPSNPN
jgi:predicted nucleic acid-binding protein